MASKEEVKALKAELFQYLCPHVDVHIKTDAHKVHNLCHGDWLVAKLLFGVHCHCPFILG